MVIILIDQKNVRIGGLGRDGVGAGGMGCDGWVGGSDQYSLTLFIQLS